MENFCQIEHHIGCTLEVPIIPLILSAGRHGIQNFLKCYFQSDNTQIAIIVICIFITGK
jgi:hypothetical protein